VKTPVVSCRFLFAAVGCAFVFFTGLAMAAPNQYANEVMADQPIAYWRLGEAPGQSVAHDETANHQDGQYSAGGITLGQPGFHGGDTAALFDGVTGRITVPNSAVNNPARITMEAKVRWDGPTDLQQRILEKESFAGTTQYGLSVMPDGHVHVELRMRSGSGVPPANSIGFVARGSETHIAATYDGLAIRIYLNGALDSTTTINTTPTDIDTKWPHTPPDDPEVALAIGDRIGIIPPDTRHRTFNGLIDEVALFDTALPENRIRAHFESQMREFQYATKFVCGVSPGSIVAPGSYFTAINVHNPSVGTVTYKKKFTVAAPGKPGPIRWQPDQTLRSDEALEIDCPEILRGTSATATAQPRFAKGFVVLESPSELDVVVVYTAAGSTRRVETMEVERVPKRLVQGGQGKSD